MFIDINSLALELQRVCWEKWLPCVHGVLLRNRPCMFRKLLNGNKRTDYIAVPDFQCAELSLELLELPGQLLHLLFVAWRCALGSASRCSPSPEYLRSSSASLAYARRPQLLSEHPLYFVSERLHVIGPFSREETRLHLPLVCQNRRNDVKCL